MSLSILKAFYPPAFETIKWWSWQCHMKWTKRERGNVILITNGSLNCSAFDFSFLANLITRIIFIRYAGPLGDDEISSVAHIYSERVVIHHASHLNHWFIWGLRFQGAIKILYLTKVVVLLIYGNCWLLSGLEWQIYCMWYPKPLTAFCGTTCGAQCVPGLYLQTHCWPLVICVLYISSSCSTCCVFI